jgi:hypothetical protein
MKTKDNNKKTKVKKVVVTGCWFLVLIRERQATSNRQQATNDLFP